MPRTPPSAGNSPDSQAYRIARLIFGNIRAEDCSEEYVYGKDGKPMFIAGPNDDAGRCEEILDALERHRGRGGHHFIMPLEALPERVEPESFREHEEE